MKRVQFVRVSEDTILEDVDAGIRDIFYVFATSLLMCGNALSGSNKKGFEICFFSLLWRGISKILSTFRAIVCNTHKDIHVLISPSNHHNTTD